MLSGNLIPMEIGSEFHLLKFHKGPFIKWPEPHVMFISGRVALLKISELLNNWNSKILFLPDYYCQEVADCWSKHRILVQRYVDGPQFNEPIWGTITPSNGDAVLAVNYFGVRDGNIWKRWKEKNSKVCLIEDHSHDPVSEWALKSQADFAFASLRKTYPVPDGSILWSPKGLQLPEIFEKGDWRGSAYKLAAMILKAEYLKGADRITKNVYRKFQIKGETLIARDKSGSSVSPWSEFLLSLGYPIEWRNRREKNVRNFLKLIKENSIVKPLFYNWPKNHCPYNVVLKFPSKSVRDKYHSKLLESHIYPSIHWDLPLTCTEDNKSLSEKLMTIPVDQRYGNKEIQFIIKAIFNVK